MKFSRPCPACGHVITFGNVLFSLYNYTLKCPKCHKGFMAKKRFMYGLINGLISFTLYIITMSLCGAYHLTYFDQRLPIIFLMLILYIILFKIIFAFESINTNSLIEADKK